MPKDDRLYLGHMLDMTRRALRLLKGIDAERYRKDESQRLALAHLVQIVGEAASHVSMESRLAHPEIPWHRIVSTRNRIVHDYLNIDYDLVWRIVNENLPELEKYLEPLGLGEEPPDEP